MLVLRVYGKAMSRPPAWWLGTAASHSSSSGSGSFHRYDSIPVGYDAISAGMSCQLIRHVQMSSRPAS